VTALHEGVFQSRDLVRACSPSRVPKDNAKAAQFYRGPATVATSGAAPISPSRLAQATGVPERRGQRCKLKPARLRRRRCVWLLQPGRALRERHGRAQGRGEGADSHWEGLRDGDGESVRSSSKTTCANGRNHAITPCGKQLSADVRDKRTKAPHGDLSALPSAAPPPSQPPPPRSRQRQPPGPRSVAPLAGSRPADG